MIPAASSQTGFLVGGDVRPGGLGCGMDNTPIAELIDQAWPAELPEPLALFLAYWQSRCSPDGRPPLRSAIDPLDIPRSILPGLGLIEALPGPQGRRRYRYRLLGTDHYAAKSREQSGQYLDALHPPEEMALVEPLYERLLAGREPHYWRRPSADPALRHTGYSRILAPLLDVEGNGAYLLGYWMWEGLYQ